MTQAEAKREAMRLYRNEYLEQGNGPVNINSGVGALLFYTWLYNEHPQVLSFRCSGDRYQVVSTWFSSVS